MKNYNEFITSVDLKMTQFFGSEWGDFFTPLYNMLDELQTNPTEKLYEEVKMELDIILFGV